MVSKILVVEDDKDLRNYLRDLLLDNDFAVELVETGTAAINYVKKVRPDLVLLDLGLPDIDGKSVCSSIKKMYSDLPVLMLTARHTTNDVVMGLSQGADDYIPKPFVGEELIARIKARLRNVESDNGKVQVEDLILDSKTMQVKRADKVVNLTKTEFDLLHYLMSNKGKVLTRENILNRIWLYSPDIESRVVDVYVGYLRKKIDSGFDKKLIQSVRGFGYTIKD
ncbi:MAG TPA: response regulator transcription factor [Patescibacteria group bacterium]